MTSKNPNDKNLSSLFFFQYLVLQTKLYHRLQNDLNLWLQQTGRITIKS